MTEDNWRELLQTYSTPEVVVEESLTGIRDHIETPCARGHTQMVHVAGVPTGLAPRPVTCDRGTRGCNLEHNDPQALRFARMAFERLEELLTTTKTTV
jgi:hypothetical protein